MDQDKFALVEKILKDIDTVMRKNADLTSFEIIPVDSNCRNKCPVAYSENCLGIESWCVKHLYAFCYTELTDNYFSKPRRKCPKASSARADRLTQLLNITLLLNPEVSTLWNRRRELVVQNLLNKYTELRFTRLVLSRKPKCNDAFAYRRWLLDRILLDKNIQSNILNNLVVEELSVSASASESSPNNYHSWNHRMAIINRMREVNIENLNTLFVNEYDFSERWASKHVSDYSCFHYRQFCLENIMRISSEAHWKVFQDTVSVDIRKSFIQTVLAYLPKNHSMKDKLEVLLYSDKNLITWLLGEEAQNYVCALDFSTLCKHLQVLFQELAINNELVNFYQHHETLWYHRRYIIHRLLVLIHGYCGTVKPNAAQKIDLCTDCTGEQRVMFLKNINSASADVYSSVLFSVILNHEQLFIAERRRSGDIYADRHEKYLRFVEGLNKSF